jgi:hypothetical protein
LTPEAEAAFLELKHSFLTQPDPELQFIVEVDASDTGIGAVLSQRSPSDQKVHPCAFFSLKLSPAERNFDIGNWELIWDRGQHFHFWMNSVPRVNCLLLSPGC